MTGIEFLLAILLLSFITEGLCACSLDTFTVRNVRTGRIIQGKPEWRVTVINNCACAQSSIKLKCTGFQSTEAAIPRCLQGNGIDASSTVVKPWRHRARSASLMLGILRSFCGQPSRTRPVAENSLCQEKGEESHHVFPFISKCHCYP